MGESYCCYIFLYFPSFPRGSFIYILGGGEECIYEKQIQCQAKNLFESLPLIPLPPPPYTLMGSCSLPSISLSQHGSHFCNYVHVCLSFPI